MFLCDGGMMDVIIIQEGSRLPESRRGATVVRQVELGWSFGCW